MSSQLINALRVTDLDAELHAGRRNLRFSGPLEAAYREDTAVWRRKHYRRSVLLALLSYNGFLLVDSIVVPDVIWLSAFWHLLVVSPLMLIAALLLSRPIPTGMVEAIGAATPLVFLAQVEVVFLSSRAESMDHYQYLTLFALMFGNTILRLPFYRSAAISAISIAVHGVIAFNFAPISSPLAVMGTMSLAAACYITLLSNAIQEGAYRSTWLKRRYTEMRSHELARDNDKLSRLSRIDPLTGVRNRRGFDLAVEQVQSAANGAEAPFCVVMLDVDFFKSYNDTYGHAEGDRCLQSVANVMTGCLRAERDVLARFGGEEFVAFIPHCHLPEASALAERIRRALVASAIPHARPDGGAVVTASFGVAEGRLRGLGALHDVIAHADVALYDAKKGGRNRVEPPPPRKHAAPDCGPEQPPVRAAG